MSHLKTKPRFPLVIVTCLLLCAVKLPARAFSPPAPKPLSKNDIIDLLKGEVPSARVSELARENGINFQLTPAVEDELRHAGATNELLTTLRDLAPKAPGIQIEITPGDAEVYVDDERVGKTSAEGRLKITKLAPGEHRIRVSLNGYKDFERTINLKGGETSNLTTQLQKSGSESISGNQSDTLGGNVPALLNKVVKAMGGKEKLKTIRSFRLKGNVVLYLQQGATPGELETVFDFAGQVWQRFTTSSAVFTLVVTPTSGFLSSAAGTQDMPILQRNELLKNVWRNAFYVVQHIDDPTFSFMAGGTAVVGGVRTEVLDVAGAGTESRWFIDPQTGFIVRASWMEMGTTPAAIVDDYADWEPVEGIFVPFKQSSTRNGQTQSTGTFTNVSVNPRIMPNLFARPGR
ncbi:MAG TPA: PEGA domain-containing protein [Terriglobia bacterium]|nr:PEGA domain-containing protein [Terriglobia bacterium]